GSCAVDADRAAALINMLVNIIYLTPKSITAAAKSLVQQLAFSYRHGHIRSTERHRGYFIAQYSRN
ncbi:MAG: hypothetical protein AAF986_04945, partial [Pseudomonadota bacterium]